MNRNTKPAPIKKGIARPTIKHKEANNQPINIDIYIQCTKFQPKNKNPGSYKKYNKSAYNIS
jgi:hypothetical protein